MIQNPLAQSLSIVEKLPSTLKEAIKSGTIVLSYVDMGQWAYTNTGEYLFTHSAGPCLNIVVHNWNAPGNGALAHVTYADTTDQQILFRRAAQVTFSMVQACQIDPADHFEIWLGAGYGYHHSNPDQTNTTPGLQLAPFILNVLEEHHTNRVRIRVSTDHFLAIVDGQAKEPDPNPGDIIYCPSRTRSSF